jgi:hypothetical protein
MSEEISFNCQPQSSQKQIISVYNEFLSKDDKLNRRPSYQRNLVWNNEQKSYLIDTIMTNCPMPIFLLYMYDLDEEYECIDGQNRLTAIKDYIEQDPTKNPFSYRIEKEEGEEHLFYTNEKTREAMQIYCNEQNKKKRGRGLIKTYRLMTPVEVKRFEKYQLNLYLITTKLSFNQRKQIFMRWQNGTQISQCDSFKNESYPFCEYVISNGLDRSLAETIGGFLKSNRNNWLWDIYRLLNVFLKNDLKEIILSSIQTRQTIEKETVLNDQFKDAQRQLEKLLIKVKPLEIMKSSINLSFLIGYIYLWRNANTSVRAIAEKDEFLMTFAKESMEAEDHNHSTLNNGPAVKAFIVSFPSFKEMFYIIVDKYTPVSHTPISKKKEIIPATIKTDVWNMYIGKELGEGDCYCCKKKSIGQRDFHAGHFIPERDGGETTVENLRPICPSCNLSMGSQNMGNFIRKHYPNK